MATRKSRRRVHQPPSTYEFPVTQTEETPPALFIAGMAISQSAAPTISGVAKVGETLTATPGTYSEGSVSTAVFKSANGGADWTEDNRGLEFELGAGDVAMVFKAVDTVTVGEDSATFDSERSGVVYPADTTIGEVTIGGPATGLVGEAVSFSASNTGDSQYLTYAWTVEGANYTIEDPTSNPVSITFQEPAAAAQITCTVDTPDNTCIDKPVEGVKVYDSQVAPPEPEPGDPLTKVTDTVLEGEPFTGNILTIVPGTAQGGTEPYTETYSWEWGTDGSWTTIDGYAGISYSLGETDKGKSVRGVVTITDAEGATLRLASLGTGIVADEPEQIVPGGELNGNAQYQAASILYWYRRWHNRDFVVTPVSSSAFTLTPNGKLEDFGRMAYTPTEGEKELVIGWLANRWDGDIAVDGTTITMTCVGGGNFHPSGGGSPRSLTVA